MGLKLQHILGEAFSKPDADHRELARAMWPVLARYTADPICALFFEANGPGRKLLARPERVWAGEWHRFGLRPSK